VRGGIKNDFPEIIQARPSQVAFHTAFVVTPSLRAGYSRGMITTASSLVDFMERYVESHVAASRTIPVEGVAEVAGLLRKAHAAGRRIFVFGNGGAAASASHFATDLGKGASDALGRCFKILSLTDNTAWITALGNDYSYEDVFVRQLMNHAEAGDVAISVSVSGDSPNCVKALEWARANDLSTVALTGGKGGRTSRIAQHVLQIGDTHYGRVEDAHMTILHMLGYAFMEDAWQDRK
jgi:D-sedoheptulose 7-phosphate isomerase